MWAEELSFLSGCVHSHVAPGVLVTRLCRDELRMQPLVLHVQDIHVASYPRNTNHKSDYLPRPRTEMETRRGTRSRTVDTFFGQYQDK